MYLPTLYLISLHMSLTWRRPVKVYTNPFCANVNDVVITERWMGHASWSHEARLIFCIIAELLLIPDRRIKIEDARARYGTRCKRVPRSSAPLRRSCFCLFHEKENIDNSEDWRAAFLKKVTRTGNINRLDSDKVHLEGQISQASVIRDC